jgi:hypothetical protein
VHGHLWVFDNLVDSGILIKKTAATKLYELSIAVNPKLGLPTSEFEERIKDWGR